MLVPRRLALPWLVAAGAWLRGSLALNLHEPEEEETSLSPGYPAAVQMSREAGGIDEGLDESSTPAHWTPKDAHAFADAYVKMRSMERRADEPMPSDVQLALGVFTIAGESLHRDTVRTTWMNQTGVCDLLKGQQKGCSVYAAFVIGKHGTGVLRGQQRELAVHVSGREQQEPRMLVLDIEENMNNGKTEEYFKVVAARYPWITHVAKCDMDSYPALHKLVNKIHQQTSCAPSPYMYAGRPSSCTPKGCDHWLKDNAIGHVCDVRDGCERNYVTSWTHNFGQLYLMSMPLVKKIAYEGSLWDKPPRQTHEDVMTGWAVHSFVQEERKAEEKEAGRGNGTTCIHVWHPRAWCHRGLCNDGFFDDF